MLCSEALRGAPGAVGVVFLGARTPAHARVPGAQRGAPMKYQRQAAKCPTYRMNCAAAAASKVSRVSEFAPLCALLISASGLQQQQHAQQHRQHEQQQQQHQRQHEQRQRWQVEVRQGSRVSHSAELLPKARSLPALCRAAASGHVSPRATAASRVSHNHCPVSAVSLSACLSGLSASQSLALHAAAAPGCESSHMRAICLTSTAFTKVRALISGCKLSSAGRTAATG